MELDQLKQAWQSERGIESERYDDICETFHTGSVRFQSVIFQRDMLETSVCGVFAVAMTVGLFFASNWTMRLSLGFGAVGCFLIPIFLWWGRRLMQPPGANFREFVHAEVDFLRRQIWLLRNVIWWYELPLGIGMILFPMGSNNWKFDAASVVALIVYQPFILSVLIWVWWVNQRAVSSHLEPLLEYHVRLLKALDQGDGALESIDEPPVGFLDKPPPEPMSRWARRVWVLATIVVAGAVVAAGVYLMQQFDRRTGVFVVVCAPVVAILVLFISGIWKRPVEDD
ncbi:MAG: hypothetical protein AAFX06_28950 [Planctomycetota bacterium]